MLNDKRRKSLLKILAEKQRASIEQLVNLLHASPATVRRDIVWLAQRELLHRVRGGAEYLAKNRHHGLGGETFQHSLAVFPAQKRAIARRAAEMCHDGETVIINGGTTTFMMVEFLAERNMKILTNSFLMAEQLVSRSQNEIIVPGGQIYREQNVILSPFDSDVTQHHYANRMFMGAAALSPMGLLERDPLLIQAEKRLINQADELVVLADSSKFANKRAGLILCPLERVSCVITDEAVPAAAVQMLEAAGVKVIAVAPELVQ
jgi:DeoR family transcriptional regulator, ulaG and ulaABCDEF operon transcriptional repressor